MKLIKSLIASAFMAMSVTGFAIDNVGITTTSLSPDRFTLIQDGKSLPVYVDDADDSGVKIAVRNLAADFGRVTGNDAVLADAPSESRMIIVGTIDSPVMERIAKAGKIDASQLKGKYEKYLMSTVQSPLPGVDEALVIAGSDRRGAIYGVYELSEQIGVSPWYDWADVPVAHNDNMSMSRGTYTAGEPAVKYRGLFLNDEAPCLTGWVKNTYGTDYGDHRFYARVFELILRLRGNMMWPAMWGWAFYADDPE
ncbi:glycosyl hydrolase 115 family protein, partial [uncultured Muribaculum sp.]